ncbi:MAG: DUF1588 domain-containing protein [Pirellulaceae bacterium]
MRYRDSVSNNLSDTRPSRRFRFAFRHRGSTRAWLSAVLLMLFGSPVVAGHQVPAEVMAIVTRHCTDCHSADLAEGGLSFAELGVDLDQPEVRERWIRAYDRVLAGEMPPADAATTESLAPRFESLRAELHAADLAEIQRDGRGPRRRLTRIEYEQVVRDLLGMPYLDLRDHLPADRESHHFRRSTQVADISRIQLTAYLEAAETALTAAIAHDEQPRPSDSHRFVGRQLFAETSTFGNREAMFFARDNRAIDDATLAASPTDESIELAIFRSAHWPYYGYPQGFVARESGRYRVRFLARAVLQQPGHELTPAPHRVTVTFRARKPSGPDVSGDVRGTGGWIDVASAEAWYETTIELKAGETFEYSVLGLPVPLARNVDGGPPTYRFPPFPAGGQPGLAVRALELTGPLPDTSWPSDSHRVVLGDLPFRKREASDREASGGIASIELITEAPADEATRLINRFLDRVTLSPLNDAERAPFQRLVVAELEQGASLADAVLVGCQAVLCSRHVLFADEPLAPDSNDAIAWRLSLLFSNGIPDEPLRELAREGRLRDPRVLAAEVDRWIEAATFERFAKEFSADWLDLKRLYRGEVDERLYPEYRFDAYLIESMEKETERFVAELFRRNEPVSAIIDTDYVYANDRLSRHYELEPLDGSGLRRVELPPGSPFGGLLTQGAILKISSNGVSTSPVVRGAWVADRLLGTPPPPPPAKVPAVEPDIRGASTIRELLARHAADASCASCHARFDPLGLALENFDVVGGWRERYRGLGTGEPVSGIDRAGHDFEYALTASVDASGTLLDGRTFADIHELKRLLRDDERQLARNLVRQLTIHATGTPVRFADRMVVEEILDRCEPTGYRARDLLRELIMSPIFLGPAGLEGEDG